MLDVVLIPCHRRQMHRQQLINFVIEDANKEAAKTA